MPRFILPLAVSSTLVSSFVLYSVTHETRVLEAQVQAKERAIERAQGDIAVLKAEKAHLLRPERIEPMARALGFAPPSAQQVVRIEANAAGKPATGALRPSKPPCGERPELGGSCTQEEERR